MERLLTCKCGNQFPDDGCFVTCESCRRPFTEEEKRQQGGCRHWYDVPESADKRVHRARRDRETF